MHSPTDITLRRVLVGHRAAVNVVDFDMRYIVSASGDRTIKVWCTSTCEFVRTLNGHKRGIACLQYHDKLVVSGSSDNTIRSVIIVPLLSASAKQTFTLCNIIISIRGMSLTQLCLRSVVRLLPDTGLKGCS